MILVSIKKSTAEGTLRALERSGAAEIRLDNLSPSAAAMKKIFSHQNAVLAACGNDVEESRRAVLLEAAIDAGVRMIDVDIALPGRMRHELIRKAKKEGSKVLLSFHDYERTPSLEGLRSMISKCASERAEIIKIACKINNLKDASRLLGLLDSALPLAVVGMGKRGKIVRITAPLLGSKMGFASLSETQRTAEGQMSLREMKRKMRVLSDG